MAKAQETTGTTPNPPVGGKGSRARKHTTQPRPPIAIRHPVLHFDSDRSKRWLHGSAATLVAHALSPMFPAGERFFIKAVMAFKDEVTDPDLLTEMRHFAAQEAIHTNQHRDYDTAVDQHYGLKKIEDAVQKDLSRLWVGLRDLDKPGLNGRRIALAVTVGLEHFTALLGHQVLSQQEFLDGVDPDFAALWSWHAAEEIEHKAVAFDVYEAVGGHWFERCLIQMIATAAIVFGMFRVIALLLEKDGAKYSWRAWKQIFAFLFIKPGVFTKAIPGYLDYYRPGFHPWDHDDRSLLNLWKNKYPEVAESNVG